MKLLLNTKTLLIFSAIFLLQTLVWANSFNDIEKARKFLHTFEYDKASEILHKKSLENNAESKYLLSALYKEGVGVKKDRVKAKELIEETKRILTHSDVNELSYSNKILLMEVDRNNTLDKKLIFKEAKEKALNGDAKFQLDLGKFYYRGFGVKKDKKTALDWVLQSATNNNEKAIEIVMDEYLRNKSYDLLVKLLTHPSKKESPISLGALGYVYDKGLGVEKDASKAIKYYEKSALLGHYKSQFVRGLRSYNGKHVKKNLDEALKWFLMTPTKYYDRSQFKIGEIYYDKREYSKALEWFIKASNSNWKNTEFHLKVGTMYFNGEGTKKDYKKAYDYFNKAKIDSISASYYLEYLYESGLGVEKDTTKAKKYNRKVTSDSFISKSSLFALGNIAAHELGDKSLKAYKFWMAASLRGHIASSMKLVDYNNYYYSGLVFMEGTEYIQVDKLKAFSKLMKAARSGQLIAQDKLDILCNKSPWACK